MSLDCIKVSEAIWTSARESTELTGEELRHIQACSSCASVLAEVQACVEALNSMKSHPAAPDCRTAVMARISDRRRIFSLRWAYACMAIIAAVIIGGALFRSDVSRPVSTPAPKLVKTPDNMPKKTAQPAPETKPELDASELEMPQPPRRPEPYKLRLKRHASAPRRHKTPHASVDVEPVPSVAKEIPEPVIIVPPDNHSALAYVTWHTGNQPEDEYHYSYTVTDPATGEVTRCTVKREGKDVEINLESDPVKPEKEPRKESKINETV